MNFKFYFFLFIGSLCNLLEGFSPNIAIERLSKGWSHLIQKNPHQSLVCFNGVLYAQDSVDHQEAIQFMALLGQTIAFDMIECNDQAEEALHRLYYFVESIPEDPSPFSIPKITQEWSYSNALLKLLVNHSPSNHIRSSLTSIIEEISPTSILNASYSNYSHKFYFLPSYNHQSCSFVFCGKTWNKVKSFIVDVGEVVIAVGTVVYGAFELYCKIDRMLIDNQAYRERVQHETNNLKNQPSCIQ